MIKISEKIKIVATTHLFPDEWGNILEVSKNILSVISSTYNGKRRVFSGLIIFLILGWIIGEFFQAQISSPDFKKYVIKYLLVALGFIITLMTFTGKIEFGENDSLEEAKEVSKKIHYYLANQLITFFIIIFSLIIYFIYHETVITLGTRLKFSPEKLLPYGDRLAFSLLFTASMRIIILPFQIYEIHRYSLSKKIKDILEKTKNRYEKNKKAG
ncbi:MAG: AbrB family transcriptional regulator [Nitrospirae bacterium]|nr:AbrB family transcriptional regulator [Nitrospirota bacterium]MCL5284185.1 AbrB family transcriptional regulator [Nitrospirota bacterium]